MFCPNCKSLLKPSMVDGKRIFTCSCGYSSAHSSNAPKITDSMKKSTEVEVADTNFEVLPITDEDCPKCGHSKAHYWMQ